MLTDEEQSILSGSEAHPGLLSTTDPNIPSGEYRAWVSRKGQLKLLYRSC